MEQKREVTKVDLAVIKKVDEYLQTRLSFPHKFKNVKGGVSNGENTLVVGTNYIEVDAELGGVFRHIIKEIKIEVYIWFQEKPFEKTFMGKVTFWYNHVGGGSNGHDAVIRISGRVNDKQEVTLMEE